ncbi:transporter [Anaerosporomusa subterranea]|uniref:Transporter n=1 Tax=Anaerosporomusa subterranea TaxID=1794912 RepID=A0A154BMN7_ANASB|nr:tripartite tricarboxylate transporter permease [Anaerosporomusa subterranea]KYZ75110.1 transporter [Anaerosporomusa subterranea]
MENLLYGFSVALTPENLLFGLLGAFLGTLVGVLPGIGPVGSMALLLGLTYNLPPVTAIITFAGIYYGSMYGGSTTSILVNIPGESSSVVTAMDGYQMARKGRGGAALFIAAIGSFVAGTFGLIMLSLLAPQLAELALKFGPPEYFSIAVFGLIVLCQLNGQGLIKSMVMVAVGLMVGTIGLDIFTGQQRMTFGIGALEQGVDFVPVAMGLFGIAEVLEAAERKLLEHQEVIKVKFRELLPNRSELTRSAGPVARGSLLGFIVGLVPGPAAVISTFISYTLERKLSKTPEEFGKGAPEGVAGPESANNSAAVGAFVPVLSLGIPFAPPTALLLSAMMIHGITPGPLLVTEHPDVFWGVIASMYIGNVMLLALNLPMVSLFVQVLRVPLKFLMPSVLLLCVVGAFAINNSLADLVIMAVAGIAGYALRKLDFPPAPLVLALVIGPMLEDSFRQSLMMSRGDFSVFFASSMSKGLGLLAAAVLILPLLWGIVKKQKNNVFRHGER